jgi:PAS domain S-box-containing protein
MSSLSGTTILLVEDDSGVARLEQIRLERAGYRVVTALTAEEGLDRVSEGRISLIILDQKLRSGASGLEFFRQVKDRGYNLPAILVTAASNDDLLVEALRAGVRDFVPKTESFLNHLEPAVTRVLDQARIERELAESRLIAREHQVRSRELEHEIARRKRVEEALRDAEHDLRLMVESVTDFAIFTVDRQARVISWNPGAEQLFGYTEHEILGQELGLLFCPEDRAAKIPETEIAVAAAKGRSSDERWHMRKDGSRFFASGALMPILDEKNQLRGFTKIARDITERKQAEEAVREAAVRLKAIVDTAVDGIITIDEHGTVESINPAAERIFGYPRADVVGRNVAMLMTEGDREHHASSIENYLRGEPPKIAGTIREVVGRRHDGTTFPMELSVGESRLGDRKIFTGIVRDITAYKKAARERTQLLAELEAERALLKEADQRKDQFLAVLAHELRNPLAPISNAAQIMKVDGLRGANFRWSLDVIESQVKQMTHLIDDLLDVSRITRGKIVLQKAPVALGEVVDLAIEATRPLLQECRHHLTVELPPTPVQLDVDAARLAQVLSNLINNAAKYTDPEGEIHLAVDILGPEIEIRVRDNGIGIAPELLPKIFDMFVQADQSPSRARGGLGIGLTLVRSLVEQHGGRVFARSDGPSQGSEFVIRLPFDPNLHQENPSSLTASDEAVTPVPPHRVLIVDDNRNHAISLGALLRSLGQEVLVAYEGHTAVELASAHRPDLMLVDIGLPGIDGYEVARRCKATKGLEQTILVAMTGYGKDEDRRRSREAGFDVHFVKPIVLEELRHFLEQSDVLAPRK